MKVFVWKANRKLPTTLSWLAAVLMLLASCGSLRELELEARRPASVTFPTGIETVLIVNHAAQQPDDVGHRYITAKKDTVISLSCDSTAYDLCRALGTAIADEEIFADVRLCEDTIRWDSTFYDVSPIGRKKIREMCHEYGVDAIVSLDGLSFNTVLNENGVNGILLDKSFNVQLNGVLRAQWPEMEKVYTFPFVDSVTCFWETGFFSDNMFEVIQKSDLEFIMRYISEEVGTKIHSHIVPHWKTIRRWYYSSLSSKWKEGSAFAASGEWEKAAASWENVLKSTQKWKFKARLLSNLALCYEMLGDFDKAIDYAEKSHQLFSINQGDGDDYTQAQKAYHETLKKRKEEDVLISKQLREN